MKALTDIFNKPLPAFKAFLKRKQEIEAANAQHGSIGIHYNETETLRNRAVEKLFAEPTIENFKKAVAARIENVFSGQLMTEVYGSIGNVAIAELTTTPQAMALLKDALKAYAEELSALITQVEKDAQEMATKNGVEYFSPPSIATLTAERAKAKEGIEAIQEGAAEREVLWRLFSPLIRVGTQAGTKALPK